MYRFIWIGSYAGIMALMTACSLKTSLGTPGGTPKLPTTPQSAALGVPVVTPPNRVPVVSVSKTPPVPILIPAANATEAVTKANMGVGDRSDPFAALPMTPTVIVTQRPAVPATNPAVLPSLVSTDPLPSTSLPAVVVPATPSVVAAVPIQTAPVQTAPVQSAPVQSAPAQTAPVQPVQPVILPPPVAQAIAVSGIVQAGSRTTIIVQVPHETTSRYAAVGDYLANGRVLVKRVETQGVEPVVILEQDGAEFVKPVGSGSVGSL